MRKLQPAILLCIILLLPASYQYAENNIQLENILEGITTELNDPHEFDVIEYLEQNPVHLKTANATIIAQIPGLAYIKALKIIEMVQLKGITDYSAIVDSAGLNDSETDLLMRCTYLENKSVEQFHYSMRFRSNYIIEPTKGFRENRFEGNRIDYFQRQKIQYENFSCGIVTSKDAGEKLLTDFYSGYLMYKDEKVNILTGDYVLEAGLGNLLWRNYAYRKSADVSSGILDAGAGFAPYSSSAEYDFFRGVAFSVDFGIVKDHDLKISLWFSRAPRSGSIDSTGNVTSLYRSSFFRTESEIGKRNVIYELNTGALFEYTAGDFTLGILTYYANFGRNLVTDTHKSISGESGMPFSIYAVRNWENSALAGELSFDTKRNPGLKMSFQKKFGTAILSLGFRSFSPEFRSMYGTNFGESSIPSNETGVYFSMEVPLGTSRLNFYADYYRSVQPSYALSIPQRGVDFLSELSHKINPGLEIILRLHYENKLQNGRIENDQVVLPRDKILARIDLIQLSKFNLRTRIRLSAVHVDYGGILPTETGVSSYIDLKYQPLKKLGIGARFSIFNTNSYESALWDYEYFYPGYAQTNANYGEGVRYSLFIDWELDKNLLVNIRYIGLTKNNIDKLGTGYDEVVGNSSGKIYVQMDLRL